jgi:Protein of unknown function (DUF2934)
MNSTLIRLREMDPVTTSCGVDPYTLTERIPNLTIISEKIYTPDDRHQAIARAAYYRAERRHFEPGHELEDWLAAERQVDYLCGLIEPHPSWDSANGA